MHHWPFFNSYCSVLNSYLVLSLRLARLLTPVRDPEIEHHSINHKVQRTTKLKAVPKASQAATKVTPAAMNSVRCRVILLTSHTELTEKERWSVHIWRVKPFTSSLFLEVMMVSLEWYGATVSR